MTSKRIALNSILAAAVAVLLARPLAAQRIYVSSSDTKSIAVIESSNNTAIATIPTPGSPGRIALTPDARWAYVANICSATDPGSVTVVDLVNNVVSGAPIVVGNCPDGIAVTPDGNEVYVSNSTDSTGSTISPPNNSVSVIRTSDNSVFATIPNVFADGSVPRALAMSPDGKNVYVSSFRSTAVIDTAMKQVKNPISGGGENIAVSPTGGVWTIDNSGILYVNGQFKGFASHLGICTAGPMVFSPDGQVVYVLDRECPEIFGFSTSTLARLTGIHVSDQNLSLAQMVISADGKFVYVFGEEAPAPTNPTPRAWIVDLVSGNISLAPTVSMPRGIALAPTNTPVGPGPLQVQPIDLNGGGTPVTVTFTGITQEGFTSLKISSSGPPPPNGFSFGTPPTYYNISTTATFSSATVCITVPTGIPVGSRLIHYSGTPPTPTDVTGAGYPTATMICSNPLASLSPFAIGRLSDTLPPVTTATLNPSPNPNGWNNTDVTILLNSTDPDGTVKQITYSASGAQNIASTVVNGASTSIVISAEGTTTVSFFATDNADNVETVKAVTIRLDKTPPTIMASRTPAPNQYGWNNTNVTVSFQCADALSGLAAGSPPAPTVVSSEGAGQSVSGTCQDLAGNSATATVSGINIDKTPPVITISANPSTLWPPNGKMVPVTVSGTMTDNPSGINPSSATFTVVDSYGAVQPSGSVTVSASGSYSFPISLEARRAGTDKNGRTYTITVTAQDDAGNQSSASTTVVVPHDQGE